MNYGEAKAIRAEIVDGMRDEWRKTKRYPYDAVPTIIPTTRAAKLYWKARNASKGVMQHMNNEREDFIATHGGMGYDTRTPDEILLSDETAHVMECALANYRKACELAN